MRIFLPNSAHLQNVQGFLRKCNFAEPTELTVSLHPKWVSVHPFVLALTAAAGLEVRRLGRHVYLDVPTKNNALNYLVRMKLFDFLGCDPGHAIADHESSGRFVPLTQIRDTKALSHFMVDIVPLLHANRREVEPVQFVISEMVRNVLEHSGSQIGAVVCAQYYSAQSRLALGIADMGVGIRQSLQSVYPTASDLDAVLTALKPGVTGTTKRLGGTDYNAGAGLFFTKGIACASNNLFSLYSGTGMFKLLHTPKARNTIMIRANPAHDFARRIGDLPSFGGTVVGIDISLASAESFATFLNQIRKEFNIDIKAKSKARFKKPKFI